MKVYLLAILLALAGLMMLLSGCGGSEAPKQASDKGKLTFEIVWPAKGMGTKVIPAGALSIKIHVWKTSGEPGVYDHEETFSRGSGSPVTYDFNNIPVGTYMASATAYPTLNGTGKALGTVTSATGKYVGPGKTETIPLVMVSSVAKINGTVPIYVEIGTPGPVTGVAYNSLNQILSVPQSNFLWVSNNPAVANISLEEGNWYIEGITEGTVTFTVTELDSGKSKVTSAMDVVAASAE